MISPGPALQRIGAQSFNNAALSLGANTVVAAGANTNGVVIRTALLFSLASNLVDLRNGAGTAVVFAAIGGALQVYTGAGIVFPPGVAVVVNVSSAAGGQAYLTYDLL